MKKFALVAAVALMGTMVLPSCKKEYTCECTISVPGFPDQTSSVTLGKATKKDAKAACNSKATGGFGSSVTCKLK